MVKNKKGAAGYTKTAFIISVCLAILWAVLGTTTSLAWVTDTTSVQKNTFNISNLDLDLYCKNGAGQYVEIDGDTAVFNESALYEPGYVQVVYLKIQNNGDVPFEYKFAVDVYDVVTARSVLGAEIYLPNYLKFGVIYADDEITLDRETAKINAEMDFANDYPLNTYSRKDNVVVQPQQSRYIALIVRMPEHIDNLANYRGNTVPSVDLGITVTASQEGTLK